MSHLIRDLFSKATNPNTVLKAFRDPSKFTSYLRAKYKKSKLDPEEEEARRPTRLAEVLGVEESELRGYQQELDEFPALYDTYGERYRQLQNAGLVGGTTSLMDARTLYVTCRAIRPDIVIETGCRYGSFDAHICAALQKNGTGTLHSIDVPGGPERFEYGHLIPDEFREHWELHIGDSMEILPDLFEAYDSIDIFLHDSKHTADFMTREYELGYPNLRQNGILASHDIYLNRAFQTFSERKNMEWCTVGNVGVARKDY